MQTRSLVLTCSLLLACAGSAMAASTGKVKICQLDAPSLPASVTLAKDKMFGSMDGASRTTGKMTFIYLVAPVVLARGQCVVADAVQRPYAHMQGSTPVKGQTYMEFNGSANATVVETFK